MASSESGQFLLNSYLWRVLYHNYWLQVNTEIPAIKINSPIFSAAPERSIKPDFPPPFVQSASSVGSKQAAQCRQAAAADWLSSGFADTHPLSDNVFRHEFRREGPSRTGGSWACWSRTEPPPEHRAQTKHTFTVQTRHVTAGVSGGPQVWCVNRAARQTQQSRHRSEAPRRRERLRLTRGGEIPESVLHTVIQSPGPEPALSPNWYHINVLCSGGSDVLEQAEVIVYHPDLHPAEPGSSLPPLSSPPQKRFSPPCNKTTTTTTTTQHNTTQQHTRTGLTSVRSVPSEPLQQRVGSARFVSAWLSRRSPALQSGRWRRRRCRGAGGSDTRLRASAWWTNAGGDSWTERRDVDLQPAAREDDVGERLPEQHPVCLRVCLHVCLSACTSACTSVWCRNKQTVINVYYLMFLIHTSFWLWINKYENIFIFLKKKKNV